ncbi:hypothetical protein ACLM5H_12670 [Fredinandcohnia humi]
MKEYVWYASYGSNLNRDRFLCYIQGGTPQGSSFAEVGCKDPSLPLEEGVFHIPYSLYFAKNASRWGMKGVAFIGHKSDNETLTYSKRYLITADQFLDVLKQENNGLEINLDLQQVKEYGSYIFRQNAWYGNILYLGDDKGYPIFTFTAPWDQKEVSLTKPSHEYLQTIITGLKEDYSNDTIYQYLDNKPGIKGKYTPEELASLIYEI